MKYVPTAFSQSLLSAAQAPILGGEFKIYMTTVPAYLVAEIVLSAAATGTLTNDAAVVLPNAGVDIQVAALTPIRSAGAPVVTISGTGVTNATLSGAATMSRPTWVDSPTIYDLPGGAAYDITTTGNEKYKEGDFSLTSITNGGALQRIGLFWLPATADWIQIGCVKSFRFNDNVSRVPKAIPCGMNPVAFIKPGMRQVGNVSASAANRGNLNGLAMFRGHIVTMRVDVVREDSVITDRMVFTRVNVPTQMEGGEGDAETTHSFESIYENALLFSAPDAV